MFLPYVENLNLVGCGPSGRQDGLDRCRGDLASFQLHGTVGSDTSKGNDWSHHRRQNTSSTTQASVVWRLRLAVSWVLEHGWVSLFAMQVLVGHIVNIFQLLRGGLSVLFEVCHLSKRGAVMTVQRLYDALRWALEQCMRLVFLAEARLGASTAPVAYSSDGCAKGLCAASQRTRNSFMQLERWRDQVRGAP